VARKVHALREYTDAARDLEIEHDSEIGIPMRRSITSARKAIARIVIVVGVAVSRADRTASPLIALARSTPRDARAHPALPPRDVIEHRR